MRITIYLEDTPQGVLHTIKHRDNGTTDHPFDSLSAILAAQLEAMILEGEETGLLVVKHPS